MYNIRFKNIKIHNFLSFGDANVDLDNRGFTLVSGRNNNTKDGALSNGSGKSTMFNAVCYALTGETIGGLSTNICNINANDNCWVDLTFDVDEDEYEIIRYKNLDGSSNLKIFVNGEDKSGKGIRESSKLLSEYLPDLNSTLIGSVILLGQGMPHKFSNNTPAGRKELLEQLSKSDFMIEDIKERLTSRKEELSNKQREVNSDKIKLDIEKSKSDSTISLCDDNIKKIQEEIESSKNGHDKDVELLNELQLKFDEKEKELSSLGERLVDKSSDIKLEKTLKLNDIKNNFMSKEREIKDRLSSVNASISLLDKDINKWENAGDTCPFCGGKITDKCKDELEHLKEQKNEILKTKESLSNELSELNDEERRLSNDIETSYDEKLKENNSLVVEHNNKYDLLYREVESIKSNLSTIKNKVDNYDTFISYKNNNIEGFKSKINEENAKIEKINESVVLYSEKLNEIESRVDVIDKMITLAKRDFRGFLLKNIIGFINSKAKEYSMEVSGNDELTVELDGNNINIIYCNKAYENLSGGEKQKIDIIIQLIIREMLCKYLGFNSNIIVLDEIFDNLDSKVCQSILNLISNKLADVGSLFIISHHTFDLQLPTDNEIIVEKNSLGVSSIVNG